MLTAAGVLIAVHFVGVLLAASFAVGEVGEVRAAWIVGVAAGVAGRPGRLAHPPGGLTGDPLTSSLFAAGGQAGVMFWLTRNRLSGS